MLKSVISKVLLICFIGIYLPTVSFGQINKAFQNFKLTPQESFSLIINSVQKPNGIYTNFDISMLDGGIDFPNLGNNTYRLEFDIADNFIGHTHLIIQYFALVDGIVEERYSRLSFEVDSHHLSAMQDYLVIDENAGYTTIDVLSNDSGTSENLTIEEVINAQHISANIFLNNIVVLPENNFSGTAYCQYVVIDDNGDRDVGTVTVLVRPSEPVLLDTIVHSTVNTKELTFFLPSESYALINEDNNGIGELSAESTIFVFSPNSSNHGNAYLTFQNDDNEQLVVQINVFEDPNILNSLVDDVIYTPVDEIAYFNVLENDFKPNNTITTYSSGLNYLGDGDFSYNPPSGYVGLKKFEYQSTDGLITESGEITIHINNYYPETKDHFSFVTKEAMPLVLVYDVPLNDFEYWTTLSPSHGNVYTSLPAGYNHRCGFIQYDGMILYEPDINFFGVDNFDLQYCVNGYCRQLKIEVEVLEDNSSCHCVGRDCVWPGDSNFDGKVDVSDILPIGLYFGENGAARDYSNSNEWVGQAADDWTLSQTNGNNIKFVDANGNGFIDNEDLNAVVDQYDNYNNLRSNGSFDVKNYPVELIPSESVVSAGDWLSVDIIVGNDEFPVLDVHGFSYTLQIASGAVDSSSTQVIHHSESWIGYNSPTLEFDRQILDGRFDLGISRTTGNAVSGSGLTHSVGFIAEEDIDGLILLESTKTLEIPMSITNIVMMDSQGDQYSLPDVFSSFTLNLEPESEASLDGSHIHVFPNPAVDKLNIYVNGADELESYRLFTISGSEVYVPKNLDTAIDVSGLEAGIYFLQTQTNSGVYMKKIIVGDLR